MRYSGRPPPTAKASKYSISAVSAQAKARRREIEAGNRDVGHSLIPTQDDLPSVTAALPRKKRKSGYYDSLTRSLKPKIYQGKQAASHQRTNEDKGSTLERSERDSIRLHSVCGIPDQPKPQWLEEALAPKNRPKRSRGEEEEGSIDSRSYRMTNSPNKRPRYTRNVCTTPIRYTTPLQHIREPILPYKSSRPSSGSDRFSSGPVHPSPTPGFGTGFSFEPETKALRSATKLQPTVSPVPFRFSSTFGSSGRPDPTLRVRSNAHFGERFETPKRMANLPISSPYLVRPGLDRDPSTLTFTPTFKPRRSSMDMFPASPYASQESKHGILPFSLPYRREQGYTDFGRKAPAMAFQPSMPVIREESEFGEANTAHLYSEPRTITPSPIWDQIGRLESSCFVDSRDPYVGRAETPIQIRIASDQDHNSWQPRSNIALISSQSSASRDENRAPSEASVVSLPIFAPKASLGIDIEALELAARSPSIDETKYEATDVKFQAALVTHDPIHSALQGPECSVKTIRPAPRSVLSFTQPDTKPFPHSSQGSKQNAVKRPVPKRRRQKLPAPVFPADNEPIKPMLPPPYKFRLISPEIVQTDSIQQMDEVESIGSFEDEVASASGVGVAVTDDPESKDMLEENITAVEAERTRSVDTENRSEISSALPVASHMDAGSDGDRGYPGFEIWQDDSA